MVDAANKMRKQRGIYNIFWGLLGQAIILGIGIFIPRLFLINYGSETNGMIASIAQILAYFSLFEAGISAAAIQALYRPVSVDNHEEINSILAATNKYFRKICVYYLWAVVFLAAIYPYFISTSLPYTMAFIIIFIMGLSGILNYYFQATYKVLLQAEGKNYVLANIGTISAVLASAVKIGLLLIGCSLVFFQLAYFMVSLVQIVILIYYIRRNYKWINIKVTPNEQAIAHKDAAFIHQVASLILTNTDVVILTAFCGLKDVSVYIIYNMFFEVGTNITQIVSSGFIFMLGQGLSNYARESFKKFFALYETYFMAFNFAIVITIYMFIVPFLNLYTSGINDAKYIDAKLAMLFLILKLVAASRSTSLTLINISGEYKKTQKHAAVEATINIVLSLFFVNYFGVYGVALGTIVALLYRSVVTNTYTNRTILKQSVWYTYRRWFVNATICVVVLHTLPDKNFGDLASYKLLFWNALEYGSIVLFVFLIANMCCFYKELISIKADK